MYFGKAGFIFKSLGNIDSYMNSYNFWQCITIDTVNARFTLNYVAQFISI